VPGDHVFLAVATMHITGGWAASQSGTQPTAGNQPSGLKGVLSGASRIPQAGSPYRG